MGVIKYCNYCKVRLLNRHKKLFCSIICQKNKQYKVFIGMWEKGKTSGSIGITTRSLSRHIKRYLFEVNKGQCSLCGWGQENTVTGNIPLEIDHVDGNAENNSSNNLRLLCPNCHSLSPHYKNVNRGNGRKWRMNKYIKNK